MKRKFLFLSFAVVLIFMLVFSSFAHGGRIDSKGGHYDRSTGVYHYHHGYPAHQHYDINGDGIVDCQYSYKDNTTQKQNQIIVSTSEVKSNPDTSFIGSLKYKAQKFDTDDILLYAFLLIVIVCCGFWLAAVVVSVCSFILERIFKIHVYDDVQEKVSRWIAVISIIIALIYFLYIN